MNRVVKGSAADGTPVLRLSGSALLLMGTVLLLGACGGGSPEESATDDPEAGIDPLPASPTAEVCVAPADGTAPAPGATLAGAAGSYRLFVTAETGQEAGEEQIASLELVEHTPEMRSLTGVDGQPLPNASAPLYGSTDLDLDALGAVGMGDLTSMDPESPGVGVYESRSPDGPAPPSIILRLGPGANTRGEAVFDGASTALRVTEIREDGFAGTWRSAVGMSSRATGWFCATGTGGDGEG